MLEHTENGNVQQYPRAPKLSKINISSKKPIRRIATEEDIQQNDEIKNDEIKEEQKEEKETQKETQKEKETAGRKER